MVAGVDDHGVRGAKQRPERPEIGLVPRGEDERVLGAHPIRELALELEVQRSGAVQQPRTREARPVVAQRALGPRDHACVVGEAEVVVRAEHDPLGALHLDDPPRW